MSSPASTFINSVSGLDLNRSGLPGAGLSWLKAIRQDGIERFNGLGLPTPKMEGWKYTSLKPLEDSSFYHVNDEEGTVAVDKVPSLLQGVCEWFQG